VGPPAPRQKLHVPDAGFRDIAYSPNGSLLATCGSGQSDRAVSLWNPDDLKLIGSLTGHEGPVLTVTFSPTDSLLATGGSDKTVRIRDIGRWLRPASHK
jgi:WD40 repeat protein